MANSKGCSSDFHVSLPHLTKLITPFLKHVAAWRLSWFFSCLLIHFFCLLCWLIIIFNPKCEPPSIYMRSLVVTSNPPQMCISGPDPLLPLQTVTSSSLSISSQKSSKHLNVLCWLLWDFSWSLHLDKWHLFLPVVESKILCSYPCLFSVLNTLLAICEQNILHNFWNI